LPERCSPVSMRACWFSGPTPTSDRASSSTPTRTQDSRTRAVRPRSSARWVPRFRRASAAEAPAATPSPVIARRAAAAPQAALLTSTRLLNAKNFLTIYLWCRRVRSPDAHRAAAVAAGQHPAAGDAIVLGVAGRGEHYVAARADLREGRGQRHVWRAWLSCQPPGGNRLAHATKRQLPTVSQRSGA
jgi:hypothetical protein